MLRGLQVDTCVDASIVLQTYPGGVYADSNDNWQAHGSASGISALPGHLQPIQPSDAGMLENISAGYYTVTLNSAACQGLGLIGIDLAR